MERIWNRKLKFEVISLLDDDIKRLSDEYILIYEDYYIKQYNSINNGYNVEKYIGWDFIRRKETLVNKNDIYNLSIYQKQIEDKKILDDNAFI